MQLIVEGFGFESEVADHVVAETLLGPVAEIVARIVVVVVVLVLVAVVEHHQNEDFSQY